jgi:delta-aminolevulinic acid dehydratase/porphobilinogen synthase
VGHFNITAGTLGCLVKKTAVDDDEIFILSNNHVLADSNQAQIGNDIIEPSKLDGGTDPIAKLTDFKTIFLDNKPNFTECSGGGDLKPDFD